jgi:SAM-dependent methyltransferase
MEEDTGAARRAHVVDVRYDEMADHYDSVFEDDVTDPATAALIDLIGPASGLRVLDLACGQGRVARALARGGARVLGIDVSENLLNKARSREREEPLGIRYALIDASAPDALATDVFDGVVCNFGLSDIDDLSGVLASAARVLPVGGWFVFSILHPCFPGWEAANAPSSWLPGTGYFNEGWWRADTSGFRGTVGANHRMLSTYFNALSRHGLSLEHAAEPAMPDGWASDAPHVDPVPVFLVARCRRT